MDPLVEQSEDGKTLRASIAYKMSMQGVYVWHYSAPMYFDIECKNCHAVNERRASLRLRSPTRFKFGAFSRPSPIE